jgi:signal transduction histidine kinase
MQPDAESRPQAAHTPPRVFGDRFREERVLKQGQRIETLYGVDLAGGKPVVIKAVATAHIPPAARMRFEHDADVLCKNNSPWLAPLLAVGQQDGLFFMVAHYQAGTTLEALLRHRRLTVAETLAVARCLLAALAAAHRQGVLHGDLKPANVILETIEPVERAVLVDCGLAHRSQLDSGIREPALDSVRCVSPEQAGMLDADVSACSDLYSLGVVLYQCLAGRPPFAGDAIGELLRQHMTQPPAELRSLGLDVPRALDEILQRLLRKDPRDRYQTAAAVSADVDSLSRELANGQADPPLTIGLHDQRQTLTEPAFVGRERELAALEAQVRKARSGRGGLVLVEAESGGGKTRLLGELCRRWAQQPVWVLRGQAQDQVGQHPFLALESIADEILAACRRDAPLAAQLRERLGDRLDAIVAVLPKLTEVLGGSPSQVLGPESFGEARTIEALVTFLAALGSENRPALVILDDCQWADEPTLKLLRRWVSRRKIERGTPSYAVLICAFRSEEVHEGQILRTLSPGLHLRLPPFASEDTRRLAESMAGSLPAEAMDLIIKFSGGSPLMASAVLRGMVESRALMPDTCGWRVERSAMDDVRSSRHAAELLAKRITLLPRVAIDLLKVAAVLGKEFDFDLATDLAGLLPGHALIGLRQAESRHLVWTRTGDARCVFVHDKVRETCLAILSAEERRDLHLRVAMLCEERARASVFDLAYHYDLGGQSERALPYAMAAAEQARRQHSLEIAEQQYEIAVRGLATADQATCYRIAEGLGDVLMLRGRYERSRQMFEAAKFLAQGDVARIKARIEGKLGELAFKKGEIRNARSSLERALSLLCIPVPRTRWGFLLHACWEILIQVLHTLLPSVFLGRKSAARSPALAVVIELYNRLAYVYWFAAGRIPCLWSHLRDLNLSERYAIDDELARAYAAHGPVMSLLACYQRAIRYMDEALRIRTRLGDVWAQGQSLNYYGFVLYAAARLPECIDKCREAVRVHERTGDFWEMHMARYQIAASLYRLGNLAAAAEEARRLHLSGIELGDTQISGISLDVWAWATSGKVPLESLQVELQRQRHDAQATVQVLVAEAVRLLGIEQPQAATEVLERACQTANAGGVRNAYVLPAWAWLATALRQQLEQAPCYAPDRRRKLRRRMASVLRAGLRMAKTFPNDLPHLLREKAMLMAVRGRTRAARRLFDASIKAADRLGFRYDRELAIQLRGEVGRELGWPGAAQDLRDAQAALSVLRSGLEPDDAEDRSQEQSRPTTLSVVDRFDTLLEAGRRLAAAMSAEAVFLEIHDAALRLLRGEECLVVRVSSDVRFSGVKDAESALVRRALSERRTIVGDIEEEGVWSRQTWQPPVEKSGLCSPVFVRGQPAACFLVTHRHVAKLFGDDEICLAEFIASIAGAALENAEGFAELQRLNATLEQRVAESTAASAAKAQELARSNHDLEQFAYVASHDLQEPLRTVAGYCRLLAEHAASRLDDTAQEYVTQAVAGARRMQDLIDDLLAYSRVGRQEAVLGAVDCKWILEQTLRNLSVVIEETEAVIHAEVLPTVSADARQLLQLFQNLIDNAIKFRRPGVTPHIRIGAQRHNREWVFTVQDNGIGIAADDLQRVFLLFQRLHTRDQYPGTGIGLAICRKAVEWHGGRIWLESEPGQGSVFRFSIPARNSPCEAEVSQGKDVPQTPSD